MIKMQDHKWLTDITVILVAVLSYERLMTFKLFDKSMYILI